MTTREEFEKAFPVPANVYWDEKRERYDEHERDWDARDDNYLNNAFAGWEAARATCSLPHAARKAHHALQNELVSIQATIESFATPAAALSALIDWHVTVATDPRVNGGMALVPLDGFVIEKGSDEYKEVIVTGPDLGMQTFWPDDAAYGLIKAMLPAKDAS